MQYPLRPAFRPHDLPKAVRLRPERHAFEVDMAVPTGSSNFDPRAATGAWDYRGGRAGR